jgi:hypothetical protein
MNTLKNRPARAGKVQAAGLHLWICGKGCKPRGTSASCKNHETGNVSVRHLKIKRGIFRRWQSGTASPLKVEVTVVPA